MSRSFPALTVVCSLELSVVLDFFREGTLFSPSQLISEQYFLFCLFSEQGKIVVKWYETIALRWSSQNADTVPDIRIEFVCTRVTGYLCWGYKRQQVRALSYFYKGYSGVMKSPFLAEFYYFLGFWTSIPYPFDELIGNSQRDEGLR